MADDCRIEVGDCVLVSDRDDEIFEVKRFRLGEYGHVLYLLESLQPPHRQIYRVGRALTPTKDPRK